MPLARPEDEVERIDWAGGDVCVIAGEDEGEYITVQNTDYFIDTEEYI
jgi:hypothetical protein